jgi:hypothetical protein
LHLVVDTDMDAVMGEWMDLDWVEEMDEEMAVCEDVGDLCDY